MEELIKEYKESLNTIKQAKETVEEEEFRLYTENILNFGFYLGWMRLTKQPGKKEVLNEELSMSVRNLVTHY